MKSLFQIFVLTAVLILAQVHAFSRCGGNHELTNKLEKAALKASKWLKNFLLTVPASNDHHIDATASHSLRLAGYQPMGIPSQNVKPFEYEPGRLGLHLNGFTATCQNPSRKIIRRLKLCIEKRRRDWCGSTHRFQYLTGALALCNTGETFDLSKLLLNIKNEIYSHNPNSSNADTLALASITLSCISRRQCQSKDVFNQNNMVCSQNLKCGRACKHAHQKSPRDRRLCKCELSISRNEKIVSMLLEKQDANDGRFCGNGISTALAAQAFLAYNVSSQKWHCPKLMQYLLSKQNKDGSFGGLMSTIQILPVLKGVTLIDHERIEQSCRNQSKVENIHGAGGRQQVHLSNKVEDRLLPEDEKEYINVTLKIEARNIQCHFNVTVKNESNVYEIFLEAETKYAQESETLLETKCDKRFQFTAASSRYGHYIDSILGLKENFAYRGHYWIMYTEDGTKATEGIDVYRPKHGSTITFKLESLGFEYTGNP